MVYNREAYLRLCKKQYNNKYKQQWVTVERVTKILCDNAINNLINK